jgi:hypothetical protein
MSETDRQIAVKLPGESVGHKPHERRVLTPNCQPSQRGSLAFVDEENLCQHDWCFGGSE